jgi:adenylylsulfate kinase-like enzyme
VTRNCKTESLTGVDGPDQAPEHTKITIPSFEATAEHQAQAIVKSLRKNGHI